MNRDAQRAVVPHLFHDRGVNPLPGELVATGETGIAAGKGFYDRKGIAPARVRSVHAHALKRLLDYLEAETLPATAEVEPNEAGPG